MVLHGTCHTIYRGPEALATMTILEYTRNYWVVRAASQLLDEEGVSNEVGPGLPAGTVCDDLHRFTVFASLIHLGKQRSDFYKRHKISAFIKYELSWNVRIE